MSIPKVSIVVPVYNVEKYLSQCLDSLISQTLREIEIICVNDGSTDGSRDILERYAKNDGRIKVIDKKNGGLASARNAGLKEVTGDYIGFVDSDDWVDTGMYAELYSKASRLKAEITITDVKRFDESCQQFIDEDYYQLSKYLKSEADSAFDYRSIKKAVLNVYFAPWMCLFDKEFIARNELSFPDVLYFEDMPFHVKAYLLAKRIAYVKMDGYLYRTNRTGSIMARTFEERELADMQKIIKEVRKALQDLGKIDEFSNEFGKYLLDQTDAFISLSKGEKQETFYTEMRNGLLKMIPRKLTDPELERRLMSYKEHERYKDNLVDKLQEDNRKKEQSIADLKRLVKEKDKIIEEMKASTSWKITKPIREIGYKKGKNNDA